MSLELKKATSCTEHSFHAFQNSAQNIQESGSSQILINKNHTQDKLYAVKLLLDSDLLHIGSKKREFLF